MLPKIIVTDTKDRQTLLDSIGLSTTQIIGFEGEEGKVESLRHWVNFGMNVVKGSPEMILIVWDADKLSPECQAILLKPLEEVTEKVSFYLMVSNENGLLPTMISRCVVNNMMSGSNNEGKYWKKVMECFAKGPAQGVTLADELTKEEMEEALSEVIIKLKVGLSSGVNKNRLKVLKAAIDCLAKIKFTNVNAKLAFGNFLIGSWKLVKT